MPQENDILNDGVSIAEQLNIIKNALNDWAIQEKGMAAVAEGDRDKILLGFNNAVGPKVLIVFRGENAYGDENSQELLGMSMRNFDVIISRGKILGGPRNSQLTTTVGPSRIFYDLVEEARDICRSIIWPTPFCLNPGIYHSIQPVDSGDWLIDTYIINFSVMVQIGRVSVLPPDLSTNGPWTQLSDQQGLQENTTP